MTPVDRIDVDVAGSIGELVFNHLAMTNRKPLSIRDLTHQLRSCDVDKRYSAALNLGRLYAETGPTDPPLATIAKLIGEANDATADVAAPFIRQFTVGPLEEAWKSQTGTSLSEWLSEMLCRQPDVKDEFAAYGLADTARDYLKGSPSVVRSILKCGKTWRAYIVASGATEPSDDEKQLMAEMAMLEDLAVASRATFNLAATYQVVHPRAAKHAWVVRQTVDGFRLFWCRYPEKTLPHRVWGWRSDSECFTKAEAESAIKKIIHPSQLGETVKIRRLRRGHFFDYEEVSVGFDTPAEMLTESSSYAISFRRFQLRPRQQTWANLPAVKAVGA